MTIKEDLFTGRITSIDVFRGITIFAMIFVNELSGVQHIPLWMKHALSHEDKMTFVDLVFPAFLFIVGMSIPFAINTRLKKQDNPIAIWKHTLKRTIALLVMGLYMVNTSYGYDASKMIIPIALWGFLAYSLPIPIWNNYPSNFSKTLKWSLQYTSILILILMYFVYIQDSGARGMTVKWWGILGLIGWAYLITFLAYWAGNGNKTLMIAFLGFFLAITILNAAGWSEKTGFTWLGTVAGHFAHASIVISGVIISLFFFEKQSHPKIHRNIIIFILLVFALGYLLRPYYEVSKIRATPSWCLYSVGFCVLIYYFIYWLIEIKKVVRWSNFIIPAASNPLLIYILPGIIIYFNLTFNIKIIPDYFSYGLPGICWSLLFSLIMLFIVKLFNKAHIQLKL
ncbi:hypothetical protein AWE51_08655 [Aquimarina aggregata]|uniref:DUF5009 domain-containing protein n=1 Tax=Aquimarina aggregata TaxID=1642818 RepID=A0A162ZCS1_9FLAO|nr:DUF5009 domain-containing protein [Aquimarina aggregata]KZS39712.1 hypothetical protein AWE51_08655 [Aquimarina aggregata]